MKLNKEKSRHYFWIRDNTPPPPSMVFNYPQELIVHADGTHRIIDDKGYIYDLKNWDIIKITMKDNQNENKKDEDEPIVSP